jgi:hypothetical protein
LCYIFDVGCASCYATPWIVCPRLRTLKSELLSLTIQLLCLASSTSILLSLSSLETLSELLCTQTQSVGGRSAGVRAEDSG